MKKEKQYVNFFDPAFYTLDVNDEKGTSIATKLRQVFLRFIESVTFTVIVNIVISANTVVLALDRYP